MAPEKSDGIIISTSGFSARDYDYIKLAFVSRKTIFLPLQWLWNTHITLINVIALNVIGRRGGCNTC